MFSDSKLIKSNSVSFSREQLLAQMKDDDKLSLIAESNLARLKAQLQGEEDDLDDLGLQVHGMMNGFLQGDETEVRAAMKKM